MERGREGGREAGLAIRSSEIIASEDTTSVPLVVPTVARVVVV